MAVTGLRVAMGSHHMEDTWLLCRTQGAGQHDVASSRVREQLQGKQKLAKNRRLAGLLKPHRRSDVRVRARACGKGGKSVGRARPPGPMGMPGMQWLTSASGPSGRSAGSAGRWLYLYACSRHSKNASEI